jgi:hypothetical protein
MNVHRGLMIVPLLIGCGAGGRSPLMGEGGSRIAADSLQETHEDQRAEDVSEHADLGTSDTRVEAEIDGGEAGADGPAASPDSTGDGPVCCPRDNPSFFGGCINLGGSKRGQCLPVCDFWCSTNWRVEVDDQGCEFWHMDYRLPAPGENMLCFPVPDGGADADR